MDNISSDAIGSNDSQYRQIRQGTVLDGGGIVCTAYRVNGVLVDWRVKKWESIAKENIPLVIADI